jgi:charged multivesicular body protein 4
MMSKVNFEKKEAITKSKSGDKRGAIFAMKKIKMYEEEMTKIQGTRVTLESQIMAIESSLNNVTIFKAMELGSQTMKSIHGDL